MPGPVLPSTAVRGHEGYGERSPKDLRSPGRQVPRYRSAMLEGTPKSTKSNKSGREKLESPGAKQTRRQRTAMLMADGTPNHANNASNASNASRMEHSRTAMLMASKSVPDPDDGTQSSSSLVSFVQGKVKGLVESVRHRN
eukprot:g4572.t1